MWLAPTDSVAVDDLEGVNVGDAVTEELAVFDPEIVVDMVDDVVTVAVSEAVPVAVPVEETVIVVVPVRVPVAVSL